jgi:hypothetical protein
MAVSTYRIWERKDMGIKVEKEKSGGKAPLNIRIFQKN